VELSDNEGKVTNVSPRILNEIKKPCKQKSPAGLSFIRLTFAACCLSSFLL
jgi:hypothetical protein